MNLTKIRFSFLLFRWSLRRPPKRKSAICISKSTWYRPTWRSVSSTSWSVSGSICARRMRYSSSSITLSRQPAQQWVPSIRYNFLINDQSPQTTLFHFYYRTFDDWCGVEQRARAIFIQTRLIFLFFSFQNSILARSQNSGSLPSLV